MISVVGILFTSCLKSDLKDLPAFNDANIDRWDFEYRWDNGGKFGLVRFSTAISSISNDTMYVRATVPNASASFPKSERDKVSLTNIIGMCNISTAATIAPISTAPKLGIPADFSSSAAYEVTAADGKTKKKWVLSLTLIKENL